MPDRDNQPPIRSQRIDHPSPQEYGFSSLGAILGANVIIIGGFLVMLLSNFRVTLPAQSPSPPVESSPTATRTPTPTKTPFQASPLTSTPTASITPSNTPSPTATNTPTPVPPQASRIRGIVGYPQSMPLSCESRSAVDWARYFGKSINEYTFFNGLPKSDNPDRGFVGSVYGSWGQIPPNPYGVHARPVAQRLREYGLNAKAVRGMSLAELKAEIAQGQPVIVWVIGHVGRGTPIPYTASNGHKTTVAQFEHTVIVIGYDKNKITFLDGGTVYQRYKKEFLRSWGVLGNMAVIWID